ncbi:ABC transporter ATP-binding protein [Clostridium sp. Marseille-P299]|uniref:ABC transporter ATP-binding protein n=1 Tax=Clostridium sp. Marseille-P299 TaxID=1805477 RepID=UPI0008324E2C|nr:ABC transporter ATP-binding protein [Clostridium sp. Marseille-P299]
MLKLENVGYRYKQGDRDALTGINCTFDSELFHAIIGTSGSGKSTLLSLMAGLDKPGVGRISINGEDLSKLNLDRYRREQVSMIFQAFQLFPMLSAIENVIYPMELNGVPLKQAKMRAMELLGAVDITKEKHRRYPSRLSGGEQQRVAIARALAGGARILLADEPTGNLDTVNGNRVIEILSNLAHNDGYCVIVVTHDLSIANSADRVYRMTDGILAEENR